MNQEQELEPCLPTSPCHLQHPALPLSLSRKKGVPSIRVSPSYLNSAPVVTEVVMGGMFAVGLPRC